MIVGRALFCTGVNMGEDTKSQFFVFIQALTWIFIFRTKMRGNKLVIFQNFNYGPFQTRQYLPNIAQYVLDGGAFLMIGGPKSFSSGGYYGTPITSILPVELPAGLGTETLIDQDTFKPLLTRMEGHTSPVSCVGISAEDEVIASGGDEGKVVLYSRATHGAEDGKPRPGSGYAVGWEDDNLLGR